MTPAVSTRVLRDLVEVLVEHGCHEQVLRTAELDGCNFQDPDEVVPASAAFKLWERAVVATQNIDLGLYVAERARPGATDVFDYSLQASPTVGAAWERMVRYQRLLVGDEHIAVERGTDSVRLVQRPPFVLPRGLVDHAVASWVIGGRRATGTDWSPLEVGFMHARPPSVRAHERVFRAPLRFSQQNNYVEVHRDVLSMPQRGTDVGLLQVLDRYAQTLLERLPKSDDLETRVRAAILHELSEGRPSAESVAKRLGLSARTLHRHLRDLGAPFGRLLDETRGDLGSEHLREGKISIAEIAYLLGFSEPSAFHRAFRRWKGMTPAAFRAGASGP